MKQKTAVIIGAGPAGLTVAYELLKRTNIKPIIIEKSTLIGGIATTVDFKGNKLDIGGHRFFTKNERVMNWWLKQLKIEKNTEISYHNQKNKVNSKDIGDPTKSDDIFLVLRRKSRIYFDGKFFDYPVNLSINTLKNLGLIKTIRIFLSYIKSLIFPVKPERNLEDFYINRFGSELYKTFFRTYSEKVWGVPCNQIDASWGNQRVKGISLFKVVLHFFKKTRETSLIDNFLYPKYGPGQLWNKVAKEIIEMGGEIITRQEVNRINIKNNKITEVKTKNRKIKGDYFFSTMAISDLIKSFNILVPKIPKEIAENLEYRDFITVGLLFNKTKTKLKDNWIYVHDKDVKVGRIQIFNNWGNFLIKDKNKVWLGMEYFCNSTENFYKFDNKKIIKIAIRELAKMNFIDKKDYLDGTVIKMTKVYPSYTGSYKNFDILKNYLNGFENLFLVGRNGMHKYNNQDHSMLTAMIAVDNIVKKRQSKSNIWGVNTEKDYHEKK